MSFNRDLLLGVLDNCCRSFTFPVLDNEDVYFAANRMSLHRSATDWAIVIEMFGFSPRSGTPHLHVSTFASRLHHRNKPENYITPEAHLRYLANNPNNESRFFFPIDEGPWNDEEEPEMVSGGEGIGIILRGRELELPRFDQYAAAGLEIKGERPAVHELCRYLAYAHRDDVLATDGERRVSVPPDLTQTMVLEEWRHPDVIEGELPSLTESFCQLADVLRTGDPSCYTPTEPPNTHWRNWPDGGPL